jgi:hypothetical protein
MPVTALPHVAGGGAQDDGTEVGSGNDRMTAAGERDRDEQEEGCEGEGSGQRV